MTASSPPFSHPIPSPDRTEWSWWASRDEEDYIVGPCNSREAVIAEAQSYFAGDLYPDESFHIVEAQQDTPERLIPSADEIITWALERAYDDGLFGDGGDGELLGKPDEQKAAIAELDAALVAWTEKWKRIIPAPWAFAAQRNAEVIALSRASTGANDGQG